MGDNRQKTDKACPTCNSTTLVAANGRNYECRACNTTFPQLEAVTPKIRISAKKRYFITCAVEQQAAHTRALATVQRYCADMKAELIVIPVTYWRGVVKDRNGKPKRRFARSLAHLLHREDVQLCKTIQVRGTINRNPTTLSPLSGLALAGHGDSFIIGHPVLHQVFFKSSKYSTPCQMTTTGSVTLPRYTRSGAGALAHEHHSMGGVIVEVEDNGSHFHLRHVGFNRDGSFIDLHVKWTADGPQAAPRAESITFGDLHAAVRVREVYDQQFEPGGLVALTDPKHGVRHDSLHGAAIHKYQNTFERIVEKRQGVVQRLEHELAGTADAVTMGSPRMKSHVVESNHDRWLDQHMRGLDMWKYSSDSEIVADIYTAMLAAARAGEVKLAFPTYLNVYYPEVNTVPAQGSLVLGDVEHVFHGDKGLRGSRGSLEAFAKLGCKTTFGHLHSPGRLRGAVQVGTCGLLTGHNGPNDAQAHTHCVQSANGKRTLVTIIDGRYRREDLLSRKLDAMVREARAAT